MGIFKKLFGQKDPVDSDSSESQRTERSKYMPDIQAPADERFTKNFILNGGKFLYCLDFDEVLESFDNILLENDWYESEVYCLDNQLQKKFDGFNLKFGRSPEAKFFLSTCENLVADDGSVLISSNQIKEKKLHELPQDLILYATTSQIINNIGEGLRAIKWRNSSKIPTNITTIKNFENHEGSKDFMTYGSSSKNLYLLLLEDL
ncbi:LUD domain-containing protein [Croceiramulus getboli]|nr:LUD domain-containing protein [Flavobacteriaceae bacterium YJPT1-3]